MVGEMWQHYKGGIYFILAGAARIEGEGTSGLLQVVYQSTDDKRVWVRPQTEFMRDVTHDGALLPRFVRF